MNIACKPKASRLSRPPQLNQQNSPQHQSAFDSPQKCTQINFKTHPHYKYITTQFDSSKKKLSDETSALWQTMDANIVSKLFGKKEQRKQGQKPTKFSQFLRQTVGNNSMKPITLAHVSESMNSRQGSNKIDKVGDSYKNYGNKGHNKVSETKIVHSPIQISHSARQYDKLNEKIADNKKMIEQLRKSTTKEDQNLLTNGNKNNKFPTNINLDHQKQIVQSGFKKKGKQPLFDLTPKPDRATYEARFHSPFAHIEDIKTPHLQNLSLLTTHNKAQESSALEQFIMGKKLGEGKFGSVSLVRHKVTGGMFALKKIPKELIQSHMMVDQVAKQIRIQSCLSHKNILSMHGFHEDRTHLYIVLEYMDGGTLFQQLKKGKLTQKQTARVMRQITQAVQYLHDLGIVHRDLKPENIVISNNIYKLCDFGWAAMCNQRRKTYCGTFDYVAPQILQGEQYDTTVDLWCLGVLAFELMTGQAPFYHSSKKETIKKIINVEHDCIVYPRNMSASAIDFIDRLIRKEPGQRSKANEALKHPFLNCLQE